MTLELDDNSRTSRARGRLAPRRIGLLLATFAFFLAGCGGNEEGAGDNLDKQVVSLEAEVALRAPVYDPATGSVLALNETGDRLVKIEVEEPEGGFFGPDAQDPRLVTTSEDLEGESSGENMVLDSTREGRAFVPQPELDHIQVMQTDDLLDVRAFDAGEPAARVALSGPRDAVYALSTIGKTVTSVDLDTLDPVAEKKVQGSEGTLIGTPPFEGPLSGDTDVFWLADPEGIALHDFVSDPDPLGSIPLNAATLAVDAENAERAYASEAGTGRIVAVEPEGEGRLDIVGETDIGEEVLNLAAEPGRLYAVTANSLVALDSASLETIRSVTLFTGERESTGSSSSIPEPSGIAVGEEGVFVTLKGEPRMLLVAKPPTEE
ncbi:MAG: hypothetical protein M3P49_09900 [Actinomycetota bacterium]|nr:hypothetical protein [Actinomycetota bacterium]